MGFYAMNFLELSKANPGTKIPTETFFGKQLEETDSKKKITFFVMMGGALCAHTQVPQNSWREGPCFQHYVWNSSTKTWKQTHIVFGENWVNVG